MSCTDPIADMLTRIRNSILARKKEVAMPLSKIKTEIAKIFKEEGYITNFKVEKNQFPAQLVIELKYNQKQSVIEGLKRVSRPGRRIFASADDVPKVLGGLGISIVSTPKGLLTGKKCVQDNMGGEVLLSIW